MADSPAVRRWLIPALLAGCTAAIYLPALGNAPFFASHDEVVYSLQAHAIASTGHDASGRFLPMYIEYTAQFGRPTYDQPILIYAIAASLKVLPFSEFAMRLPMAVASIVDVVLLYGIALVVFESELFAIAAAAFLALTPVHFMHARTAIDFQLSVPFVLGWLLCLVLYLRRGTPRLLLAGGLALGVSLFGYIAALVLVPILVLCTVGILLRRRDPLARYGWLAAGLLLPCLLALPWMLRYPLPFRAVIAHYTVLNGSDARTGIAGLVKGFAGSSQLRELPALYASFWDPEFLFINGPQRTRATQLIGVFLIAVSGAMLVGVVQALRRRSADDLLVLAGLLTGPLVASLGGEAQAVWRTLQIAPFGALLAADGLRTLWNEDSRASRVAMLIVFVVPMALGVRYHDLLLRAQALVRAATVPLIVAGFAVLLRPIAFDRMDMRRTAIVGLATLLVTHAVFLLAAQATTLAVLVLAIVALVALVERLPAALERPAVGVGLLALATATFMYEYVDYGQLHRIGPIPATLVILAVRLAIAGMVLASALVICARSSAFAQATADRRSAKRGGWSTSSGRAKLEPRAPGLQFVAIAVILVGVQVAYYAIDFFTAFPLRAVHAAVVLAIVIGLSALVRPQTARVMFGQVSLIAVVGLVAIQFLPFYVDYFTEASARGSAEVEGNVRGAFEEVIERANQRSIPKIYLGRIGPYAFGELFWKFYLLKHHREDLEARTIAEGEFTRERVRDLPAGSIVVTSPTRDTDRLIETMAAAQEIRSRELLKAPDGAPIFWILETP